MRKDALRWACFGAALLLLNSLTGGAVGGQAPAKSAPKQVPSDTELEKAIRARFEKSRIAVNHFLVEVRGGVATITGSTDVVQHKGTATRLAKAAGARKVVNKVQISEAARQKAAASLTTGRRRAQVKRSEAER